MLYWWGFIQNVSKLIDTFHLWSITYKIEKINSKPAVCDDTAPPSGSTQHCSTLLHSIISTANSTATSRITARTTATSIVSVGNVLKVPRLQILHQVVFHPSSDANTCTHRQSCILNITNTTRNTVNTTTSTSPVILLLLLLQLVLVLLLILLSISTISK